MSEVTYLTFEENLVKKFHAGKPHKYKDIGWHSKTPFEKGDHLYMCELCDYVISRREDC